MKPTHSKAQAGFNNSLRRSAAFSMIEILVVMAVAAVIAAIMIPSYSAVKKRTRSILCMNNLRQIGTATMLYASDTGHLPHSSHFKLWCDWAEFLIPYMDHLTDNNRWVPGDPWACGLYKLNGTVIHLAGEVGQGTKNPVTGQVYTPGYPWFTCPSGPASRAPSNYDGNAGIHIYSHNYACNEYLMPYGRWANSPVTYASEAIAQIAYIDSSYVPFPPVKLAEIDRPGSLILFCDTGVDAVTAEASDTIYAPLYNTVPQPGSPSNPDGSIVLAGGIVDGFATDPVAEQALGATPVPTASTCDNDDGSGFGWPVYYRHQGRCNAIMADGHVQSFANGEMQRRNFVSRGHTKNWSPGAVGFIDAYYP